MIRAFLCLWIVEDSFFMFVDCGSVKGSFLIQWTFCIKKVFYCSTIIQKQKILFSNKPQVMQISVLGRFFSVLK